MKIERTINITPEDFIKQSKAFDQERGQESQGDALVKLYKFVFPEWDQIDKINGWPRTNRKFSEAMFSAWIEFDRKVNERIRKLEPWSMGIMPGGGWMNNGFGTDEDIPDNTIRVDCDVAMMSESVA